MRLPEFRAGDPPPTLEQMRALVAAARQSMAVDVAPPLDRTGNNLRLDTSGRSFWAQISGSNNPYGLTELEDDGLGGWRGRAGGTVCSSCGYEANGATGLNVKIYRVRRGRRTGEWRFVDDRFAPPCLASFEPIIGGCFHGTIFTFVSGCTLTLRDSLDNVVLDRDRDPTCTTAGGGSGCFWDLTYGASYTLTVDPPAGVPYYDSTTYTFTARCNLFRPLIRLPIADGYACCPPCDGELGGIPIPKGLELDYGSGVVALDYVENLTLGAESWSVAWYGRAAPLSFCSAHHPGTDAYGNPACLDQGKLNVLVDFVFTCNPSKLHFWLPGTCCPDPTNGLPAVPTWSDEAVRLPFTAGAQADSTCDPMLMTFLATDALHQNFCFNNNGAYSEQDISWVQCVFGSDPNVFTLYQR